ncbi:hypothetical protein B484DRAFT_459338 [Ochromonadaceae sp. CCMP2298]|nr:hypothetical protein B484DRAFT_459338 [Ochromonadaceae sp. CCMP2298]
MLSASLLSPCTSCVVIVTTSLGNRRGGGLREEGGVGVWGNVPLIPRYCYTIMLYCYTTILYYTTIPLYCYTTLLLYYYTTILLYYYTIPAMYIQTYFTGMSPSSHASPYTLLPRSWNNPTRSSRRLFMSLSVCTSVFFLRWKASLSFRAFMLVCNEDSTSSSESSRISSSSRDEKLVPWGHSSLTQ